MPIAELNWDEWSDSSDQGSRILHPCWEQVEEAILMLDGNSRTIVTLRSLSKGHMMVGGGGQGRYLVLATFDNSKFFNLTDLNKSDKLIMMDVGGQPGEYPEKRCVSLDVALNAAKTYFERDKLEPDFIWA